MAKRMKPSNKPHSPLPKHVEQSDTEYPKGEELLGYTLRTELGLDNLYSLVFYFVPNGPGWVLTTLRISGKGRGETERFYGIGVDDGKVYTVGRGPHVEKVVEVYPKKSNLDRLQPLIELWKKGLADASVIRDRISSRRAQGQAHRAAGRTHWNW